MLPTSNILCRVFYIRTESAAATGFIVEVDGREYLVTARHVIPTNLASKNIEIQIGAFWKRMSFIEIAVEPATVDITVLSFQSRISTELFPVKLEMAGTPLAQPVYFLGFPGGISINGHKINNGYPLPIVKHGIISYFATNEGDPFFIDGINTFGFSGGPVFYINDSGQPNIIGVISSFIPALIPVFANGTEIATTTMNTGLAAAYSINYAINAINKRPNGFKL